MAIGSALRCRQCGSRTFNHRHPTGRPRCAVCGTFAFGPEVARWRGRWKRRIVFSVLALAIALAGVWMLREAGVLTACPHPALDFVCDLAGLGAGP
ncbi:MAG: hypothetical protein R3229_09850 [Alphaproteobacteria bacterium]|nr:hypothetical protein [Alphaproteobacteria bacterium]